MNNRRNDFFDILHVTTPRMDLVSELPFYEQLAVKKAHDRLTTKQLAEHLEMGIQTYYRLEKHGICPSYHEDKVRRYLYHQLFDNGVLIDDNYEEVKREALQAIYRKGKS